jgi:HSP20 family protein
MEETTMMNITRYNPVNLTSPLDDVFGDFLHGFLQPVRALPQAQIRMDVTETEDAYTVHAEIPGVKKDDIQVTIEGAQVTISAEINKVQDDKDKDRLLRTERYYGNVFRSFTLAQEVDETGAEAKYDAGVLELRLPKKATTAARKLTIQ